MPQYQLIFLDFDGTLVDSRQDIATAVNLALNDLNFPALSTDKISSFVGSGVRQLMQQSLKNSKDPHILKTAAGLFNQYYEKHCLDQTSWYPKVYKTLKKISQKKVLLTNKPLIFTQKILDGLKGNDLFCDVITGGDHFPKKPDPTGLLSVLEKRNVKVDCALLVGDSTIDLETAKRAGCNMVYASYGFEAGVMGARYQINRFEEILKWI